MHDYHVNYQSIANAKKSLESVIYKTNLVYSQTFSNICGNDIFLKTENFQKTGSFKIRGALNKILNLTDEEKARGVITASAGNHAQGVAYAASIQGIKAVVVMPETTPIAKITATREYGAEVLLHGSCYDDAFKKACEMKDLKGFTFIHAFDDPYVIAGQGTVGLEILEDNKDMDIILVPVGGGGLISGVALAAKSIKPDIKIIGVESAGFDAMRRSVEEGERVTIKTAHTIADGIAVKRPGDLTFSIVQKYVDDIVTVTEHEIASTILMLLERAKIVSEGAGAASLAAILDKKILAKDKKVCAVISGGNIDINLISTIIHKGLIQSGRKVEMKTIVKDKPGQLRAVLGLLSDLNVNIVSIHHNRDKEGVEIGFAEVDMVLETQNRDHAEKVFEAFKKKGYQINL
ncbi:MAG: threonine ammonia-lyase [Clostridia bacterium]|nr:threonine ammonia-lyase [Clostridia bacterium]